MCSELYLDKIAFAQIRQFSSHGTHGCRFAHFDIRAFGEGYDYILIVLCHNHCGTSRYINFLDSAFDHCRTSVKKTFYPSWSALYHSVKSLSTRVGTHFDSTCSWETTVPFALEKL